MAEKHIDNDILMMYVKTMSSDVPVDKHLMNSAQYHEVLDHLAVCEECREQVSAMNTLHAEWPQLHHRSRLTDEQQQLICDYLDGYLQEDKSDTAKNLIHHESEAMKSALHYQCHKQSMAESFARTAKHQTGTIPAQAKKQQADGNLIDKVMALLGRLVSVQSHDIIQHHTMIASYQDNPTIQFTEKNKLPGVGFFTNSASTSRPFNDINIEMISDDVIKISWPEVDNAELYKMRIQVFKHGRKTLLKETTTSVNHANFRLQNDSDTEKTTNKRYEWILYGNTTNDKMFHASGGFIIDRNY